MLKKIGLSLSLIVFALFLSACTTEQKTTPTNSNNNLIINKNINNNMTNNIRTLDGQIDLAAEYKGALIKTNLGNIEVELYVEDAPLTVNNFLNLAKDGFYDNTKFHRIIKDFMIQGGDPNSRGDNYMLYGTGGPGYAFKDEINSHKLVAGSLAMANSGPNTNGSQFFIVTLDSTPWLDGKHTNFGKVVSGMDVVMKIEGVPTGERDLPLEPVVINGIELIK
ncbi:peptidylprolyl isomerase [Candidatus Falkowbacteria bacterium]|nr:peptidylprolyl isomerase [Candidatus Falkowbacteria bacterium]